MNSHKPHVEHTPGLWSYTSQPHTSNHSFGVFAGGPLAPVHVAVVVGEADAALIASTPTLLAERDALRVQVAKLRSAAQLALEWSEVSPVDPQFRSEVAATLRAALA